MITWTSICAFIASLDLFDEDDLYGAVKLEEHMPVAHPESIAVLMLGEPFDVWAIRKMRRASRLLVNAPACLVLFDFSELLERLFGSVDGVHDYG